MNQESLESIVRRIVLRCWADAEFKACLLADPVAVLHLEGLSVASGVQLNVVEDTPQCVHWVLPHRPANLSDEELDQVAGGKTMSTGSAALNQSAYPIIFAKPVGAHSQASVVWLSTNPFSQTKIDWTTSYSIYTR